MKRHASKEASVGYCRPPRHTRFQSGKSGNPKGRPRNSRNLKSIIFGALTSKITLREDGRVRKVSKIEGAILRNIEKALKGDHHALASTLKLAMLAGLLDQENLAQEANLTPTEERIFEDVLKNGASYWRTKRGRK